MAFLAYAKPYFSVIAPTFGSGWLLSFSKNVLSGCISFIKPLEPLNNASICIISGLWFPNSDLHHFSAVESQTCHMVVLSGIFGKIVQLCIVFSKRLLPICFYGLSVHIIHIYYSFVIVRKRTKYHFFTKLKYNTFCAGIPGTMLFRSAAEWTRDAWSQHAPFHCRRVRIDPTGAQVCHVSFTATWQGHIKERAVQVFLFI